MSRATYRASQVPTIFICSCFEVTVGMPTGTKFILQSNTSKWDIVRNFVLLGLFGFEMFEILWVLELLTGAPYWDSE